MNTDLLKKYAALVIRVGVNLQKDQPLVIHAPITCADFVHALTSEGYDAGAYDVAVNWNDEEFAHIRFQKAASERFKRPMRNDFASSLHGVSSSMTITPRGAQRLSRSRRRIPISIRTSTRSGSRRRIRRPEKRSWIIARV